MNDLTESGAIHFYFIFKCYVSHNRKMKFFLKVYKLIHIDLLLKKITLIIEKFGLGIGNDHIVSWTHSLKLWLKWLNNQK